MMCLPAVALLFVGAALRPAAGIERAAVAVNRPAPDFSRVDLDGRRVELAAYRGKVVLLNFWATWCAPCIAEMPRFDRWQKEYGGRGLQVLGVSMDDETADARSMCRKLRVNYPVVMGDEGLGESYGGIFGLPVTFLIDTKGTTRYVHQGETDLNALDREIQALLPR